MKLAGTAHPHVTARRRPEGGGGCGSGEGAAWADAVRIATGAGRPLPDEWVPTATARGRVLAADVRAAEPMPAFDTAAMDGYAVRGPGPWHLAGRLLAGAPGQPLPLRPGTAVEIMTGAVVPDGASVVVPYEEAAVSIGLVHGAGRKSHIRHRGEDVAAGALLASAGRRVTAALQGLLAQAAIDSVAVRRPARVRLVITGDEIVHAGTPRAGQVRDAIRPLVEAVAARAGALVAEVRHLGDDPRALAEALHLGPDVDVVVVTGSSSAGAADHLRPVLAAVGARVLIDGVACRPGRPQLLAHGPEGGGWVAGLPGNPLAALVACLTILEPLLGGLSGTERRSPLRLPVGPAASSRAHGTDATRLVPVRFADGRAEIVAGARAGSLRAAAEAEAVAVLEPGWRPGQPAELLPLP
jgi:molybdopterin molybdotransferase